MNIKSTWGDIHYVGLTGIEVFTITGQPAKITKVGIHIFQSFAVLLIVMLMIVIIIKLISIFPII